MFATKTAITTTTIYAGTKIKDMGSKVIGKAKSKYKKHSNKGASGANENIGDADFYVGPDGTVTKSLDAYHDFIRMKGMTKDQIVNQIINGERIGSD